MSDKFDFCSVEGGLEHSRRDFAQLERDYEEILAGTGAGVVWLDRALVVRRYSPLAAELLQLSPEALGRPLVSRQLSDDALSAGLQAVLAGAPSHERELSLAGRHYREWVMPLGDGLVVAYVDFTDQRAAEAERTRLKSILDALPDGIYIVNEALEVEYVNPVIEREFGPVGARKCHDYFHGLGAPCAWCKNGDVQSGQAVRWQWTGPRGRTYDVHDIPICNADGSTSKLEVFRDITERVEADERLRLAARVFDESVEGIVITDAEHRIAEVNRAFTRITGYSADEVRGRTPALLASGRHDAAFFEAMKDSLRERDYWQGEIWNRRKNGELFPEQLGISAVRDGKGEVTHYLGIFTDITERKTNQARIEYMAHHDGLTGLPNRALLRERFAMATAYALRAGSKSALLLVDIDRFKAVNDSLGHAIGDDVLRGVAKRLREAVRDTDTVSRSGGDEFLVVLSDLGDVESVGAVVAKILEAGERHFIIQRQEISVSLSVGVAVAPDDGQDFDTLLKMAETAVYHAKEAGRNTYRFFDQRMNVDAVARLQTATGLRHALARSEFRLHYQPQIDIASGRVIGVEALIRWQHPEHGLVPPGQFIPVAEDSGLIVPIGEWVLNEACRQAVVWQQAGRADLTVAVNLSAIQFRRGDIEQTVMGALTRSGLDPRYLELELTESLLLSNTEHMLATVHRLKALGLKLSIDDFGTGYSSLAYLKRFAVDRLKIDQSFVRDMATDPEAASIVRAIIQMARGLNLRTVSEGVEDERLLDYLRLLHCDEAQGYYFARPMPAAELEAWLDARD